MVYKTVIEELFHRKNRGEFMTLEEAIEQFKYDAECNRADLDLSYAEDNEQIAEWLEELVMLRLDSCMIHMPERLHLVENGYNKGIDDFANACKSNTLCQTFGLRQCDIDKIAEQLKAGITND